MDELTRQSMIVVLNRKASLQKLSRGAGDSDEEGDDEMPNSPRHVVAPVGSIDSISAVSAHGPPGSVALQSIIEYKRQVADIYSAVATVRGE